MASVQQSIEVKLPVHAVYSQLMHFEDYPQFMDDVKSVQQLDDNHLHWTTMMANRPVEWDAEITEKEPDRCIAWRNVSGPTNSGRVELQPVGTEMSRVVFTLETQPEQVPGSMAGNSQEEIEQRLKQNLMRLRTFIESRGSGMGQSATSGTMQSSPQMDVDAQGGRGSPRNSPVPTSSYGAGSEGFSGDEEWSAPVTSSNNNAMGQQNNAAGLMQRQASTSSSGASAPMATMRHVGEMPQDTSKEVHSSTSTSDSMGQTMQQGQQQDMSQKQPVNTAGVQSPPDQSQQPGGSQAADINARVGGMAAEVGAAGGTDASAGARMAGGPATHGGGAPGGAATAGTTEPLGTTAAGGGTSAAGAPAAGGTGLGGADLDAGAGDTRIVPESPSSASSGTSTPGGTGVSTGRNPA